MFQSQTPSKTILTVSHLNRLARTVLENEIGQVWLSAEISNFIAASSGHWYFTLKDNRSQVKAAMFKGANRRVQLKPKEGDKVLVRANIGLYEPRGDYQLIVEHIEPEGEGQLKQQFDQLKAKLSKEGLFDFENKKPLPKTINKVGIVTSATGAALHDILTVLQRRNPSIEVFIYPTLVQGSTAVSALCEAIETANHRNEVDVLIVGRGGGSLEDLWCFNSEELANVIFASRLPIVSAVGHEVDVSIADFVADLRAPTPSAAAELVSDDQSSLLDKLTTIRNQLIKGIKQQLQVQEHKHQLASKALLQNHPQKQLEQQHQFVDQIQARLKQAFDQSFIQAKQRQHYISERLQRLSPSKTIATHTLAISELNQKLTKNCQNLLKQKQQILANNSHLLETVSPLATLSRGYNIGFKGEQIVKSVTQLTPGDELTSRFVDGEVVSVVTKIND
ncbi:exodeoxyribonuclease VII large subunit [Paraglaciecola sp. 2405UD69-4]|uniref:exodeoxyribonuclease VII large subunit n=1 Tax=Paraglaciecola sp. 2405UD69-4 TaxID=3391836 RepID=UPI0039C9A73A